MPSSNGERQQRALQWIQALCDLPHRVSGTLYERLAAEEIAKWLEQLGLTQVQVLPARGGPRPGRVLALHAAVGLLGFLWGGLFGVLLAVLAWVSFSLENRRHKRLLSNLLPAPDSVNVVARHGSPHALHRVVLSAHIDTTEAGAVFSPKFARWFASWNHKRQGAQNRLPVPPLAVPELLLVAGALVTLMDWTGSHGFVFGLLELGSGLGLFLTTALGVQWAWAKPTPGANDNASAVAAMLLAAEQVRQKLGDEIELVVAGTGAEECGSGGMWEILDSHPQWDRDRTFFINFECVGGGNLHYVSSEGLLGRVHYPPRLLEVARCVAASGSFGEVTPVHLLAGTDGKVPVLCGYPTLSLITLDDNGVPRNYHLPEDTPDQIDPEAVVRAADFGAAVAEAAVRGNLSPASSAR